MNHHSPNTSGALRNCTSDYRIWLHNVWGMNEEIERPAAVTDQAQNIRDDNLIALILAYSPDVIGLQEYWGLFKDIKSFENTLLANGYTKAPVDNTVVPRAEGHNAMPIFYKTARFTYVYGEYVDFGMNDPSKGATIVVLKDKDNGKTFGVASTHFASNNGYVDDLGAAQALRIENAKKLDIAASYVCKTLYPNIPMIIGGDMNARLNGNIFVDANTPDYQGTDVCQTLAEWGYQNLRDLAVSKNDQCSCHGYPIYDATLGVYNDGALNGANHSYSIDHTYAWNASRLTVQTYCIMSDPIIAQSSDHCPQLIDFSIQ